MSFRGKCKQQLRVFHTFSHSLCWFTAFRMKHIQNHEDLSYWRITCWELREGQNIVMMILEIVYKLSCPVLFSISAHLSALSVMFETVKVETRSCDSTFQPENWSLKNVRRETWKWMMITPDLRRAVPVEGTRACN